jgi:hypothetical protein
MNPRDRLIVALDVPEAGAAHALVDRLHRHEPWRKTPMLRATTPADLTSQRHEAKALLDDLRRHLAEMDPTELVRAASFYTHLYRRKEGVVLRRDGDAIALQIEGQGTMPVETSAEYLPLFERVFGQSERAWLRVEDAIEVSEGRVEQADIFILLQQLVDAGVLESKDDE